LSALTAGYASPRKTTYLFIYLLNERIKVAQTFAVKSFITGQMPFQLTQNTEEAS